LVAAATEGFRERCNDRKGIGLFAHREHSARSFIKEEWQHVRPRERYADWKGFMESFGGSRELKQATRLALVFLLAVAAQAGEPASPASEAYSWHNVTIGGGGFVTGIITHPSCEGLMYARTDVGGAYRWDTGERRWIPLTDWIGAGEVNLTGIESVAVDPSDPDRVYLAAGTYSRGTAAILRSKDRGKTFEKNLVPFRMGANEMGRFSGERLAVDPNQGGIIFFGSRQDGLWKSRDRGATWNKVDAFPETSSSRSLETRAGSRFGFGFGQQPVGIVTVLFDSASGRKGNPTLALFAAVSKTETNLFRSVDGGANWSALPGQPSGLRPNHLVLSPDRILYVTYGKEAGPNTMTDGAIWKYDLERNEWTDITPLKPARAGQPFGYGAIATDARHPANLLAATFNHWDPLDEIFRSTNGGATWKPLLQRAQWDHSSAPYTKTRKPHWIGDLEISPTDSDHAVFVTGYGIWSCENLTQADEGKATRWTFLDAGLEETVALALVSPPEGPHLISGVGDIDGFRHDDLAVSPQEGSFSGPRFSNTEDLAWAGSNPLTLVRCGTSPEAKEHAAISVDGGLTWKRLASDPPNSRGAGSITISADVKTIVWTPRRCPAFVSVDRGIKWTICLGLPVGIRVVADSVDSDRFYAFDSSKSKFLISTNAAASFASTEASLPTEADGPAAKSGFGAGLPTATVLAAPGIEGQVWLVWRDRGLFRSTNAGTSFTKLEEVGGADSLGFGKGARGGEFGTMYLAGRVGKAQGLFRSTDAGETWTRINDDNHQFGWISHVTGDPRLFGRVYFGTGGRGIMYGDPVGTKSVVAVSAQPGSAERSTQ
jgi:hypothetical protein